MVSITPVLGPFPSRQKPMPQLAQPLQHDDGAIGGCGTLLDQKTSRGRDREHTRIRAIEHRFRRLHARPAGAIEAGAHQPPARVIQDPSAVGAPARAGAAPARHRDCRPSGAARTTISVRPDASNSIASQRPSGENAGAASSNGLAAGSSRVPP